MTFEYEICRVFHEFFNDFELRIILIKTFNKILLESK